MLMPLEQQQNLHLLDLEHFMGRQGVDTQIMQNQ